MSFSRIVLGVDFSEASLAAARWAALHLAPRAEIVLAHVREEPAMPAPIRSELGALERLREATRVPASGGLWGLAQLVGAERCRLATVAGDPASALAALALDVDADLVCIGRGRRRQGSARFGAALAPRLVARSAVPTLVVHAPRAAPLARVVAGVGHDAATEHVVRMGCDLAAAQEATVETVHVVEPGVREYVRGVHAIARGERAVDVSAPVTSSEGTVADDWLHRQTLAWLASLLGPARDASCRAWPVVAAGDPGAELLAHCQARAADLLVVGVGGDAEPSEGAAIRHVGSTARFVVWAAPCPVLVIPPPAPRRDPVMTPLHPGRRRGARPDARRGGFSWTPDPLPPAARRMRGPEEDDAA